MHTRTKAREIALCVLYEVEISQKDFREIFQNYLEKYPQKKEIVDFGYLLVEKTLQNKEKIDNLLKKYLKNWKLNRLANVDRNILRLACAELFFVDTPFRVSINEAVELAKKFGDLESPRFVNGVLDHLYKSEIETEK